MFNKGFHIQGNTRGILNLLFLFPRDSIYKGTHMESVICNSPSHGAVCEIIHKLFACEKFHNMQDVCHSAQKRYHFMLYGISLNNAFSVAIIFICYILIIRYT